MHLAKMAHQVLAHPIGDAPKSFKRTASIPSSTRNSILSSQPNTLISSLFDGLSDVPKMVLLITTIELHHLPLIPPSSAVFNKVTAPSPSSMAMAINFSSRHSSAVSKLSRLQVSTSMKSPNPSASSNESLTEPPSHPESPKTTTNKH